MAFVESFAPVAARDARVLVLGSMPGRASLAAVQYYAHPRNAFWPIAGAVCGFDPELPYARRLAALKRAGVALWDVLQSCVRPGSLDGDIDPETAAPNDFAALLRRCPRVAAVCCNGAVAFDLFRRRVLSVLSPPLAAMPVHRLPSTSPAHAGMPFERKLAAWHRTLAPLLRGAGGCPPPRSSG